MRFRVFSAIAVFLAVPALLGAQWADVIGGTSHDLLLDAVPLKGGGYLAVGYTKNASAGSEDGWLVKLDDRGRVVWQKSYGGYAKDIFRSVQEMADGTFIIAGSTVSWKSGSQDIWLLKVNRNGAVVWQKTFGIKSAGGFAYYCYVSQTALTAKNEVLICGNVRKSFGSVSANHIWCGALKPNGAFRWTRLMGCDRGTENPLSTHVSSVRPTRDGGAVMVGDAAPYAGLGDADSDAWLAKLDKAGNVVWTKGFDQNTADDGSDAAETPEGEFLLVGDTGTIGNPKDIFVMKTDPDGGTLWQKQYGTGTGDSAVALVLPEEGGAYVACQSAFGFGMWTGWGLRLNADGKILWQSMFRWKAGTSKYREANVQNAEATRDGGYIVVGYEGSTFSSNGFLVRLPANGKACGKVSKASSAKTYPSGLQPADVNLGAVRLTFSVLKSKAVVKTQKMDAKDQCL